MFIFDGLEIHSRVQVLQLFGRAFSSASSGAVFDIHVANFRRRSNLLQRESGSDLDDWIDHYNQLQAHHLNEMYPEIKRLLSQYPKWSAMDAVRATLIFDQGYSGREWYREMERILKRYGPTYSHECLAQTVSYSWHRNSMLHLSAAVLGRERVLSYNLDVPFWSDLFSRTVAAGVDLHSENFTSRFDYITIPMPMGEFMADFLRTLLSSYSRTTVRQMKFGLSWNTRKVLDDALNWWMNLLSNSVIDLERYKELENAALARYSAEATWLLDHDYHSPGNQWLLSAPRIAHGKDLSDWFFIYSSHCDDAAGDFWAIIERPVPMQELMDRIIEITDEVEEKASRQELQVPGTWVDDQEIEEVTFSMMDDRMADLSFEEYGEIVRIVQDYPAEEAYELLNLRNLVDDPETSPDEAI